MVITRDGIRSFRSMYFCKNLTIWTKQKIQIKFVLFHSFLSVSFHSKNLILMTDDIKAKIQKKIDPRASEADIPTEQTRKRVLFMGYFKNYIKN